MTQVIQGQLDDATVAAQQIQSDLTRLQSEVALARSTQEQREQQLKDAVATSKFALAEFTSEQDQLNKTLAATEHAIRLVKAQLQMDDQQQRQLGSADAVVNNLLQSSAEHFSDEEKEIMSEYVNDPKPSQTVPDRPQQLLQTLTSLHERLQKEQSTASSEHQIIPRGCGASPTQRKREHTRLDGKIASLAALMGKVETSAKATKSACSTDAEHKASIQKFIEEESDSLRTTLKQMPQLSSELLFDLDNVVPV
eukprot:CAMPEP_0169165142 /NCGR_PEP_ID=MMETSP1015-20121227/59251_1 /TAXON_ID=342587 /ORGANISM="Karlodinium micrum, Strain CCMP2283" /LENGTH=252 /DNA_ID=CAMNT_0009237707 /DNA_START=223 /DNA_END=979 /DNA_ORIENTATION=+